jgi:hypothetical protein
VDREGCKASEMAIAIREADTGVVVDVYVGSESTEEIHEDTAGLGSCQLAWWHRTNTAHACEISSSRTIPSSLRSRLSSTRRIPSISPSMIHLSFLNSGQHEKKYSPSFDSGIFEAIHTNTRLESYTLFTPILHISVIELQRLTSEKATHLGKMYTLSSRPADPPAGVTPTNLSNRSTLHSKSTKQVPRTV